MRYQFNFGFLSQWLEANPDIQKGAILYALGTKANNSFKAWAQGEGAMPIITILRFCNSFQIPISAFIKDLDAGKEDFTIPALPSKNDMMEPVGGFLSIDDRRGRGERSLLNPLDVKVVPSVVPGAVKKDEGTKTQKDGSIIKEVVVGNISDENMKRILEIEAKHTAQQNRLLDIIADQQRQINDLISLLHKAQNGNNNNMPYDMAADSVMMR